MWFKNFDLTKSFEDQELVEYRLGRVLFGVASSPFLLEGTLIVHAEKYPVEDPDFVKKMLDALHVDDLVSGSDYVVEGEDFFLKCKERLALASFNLKKIQSNDDKLESLIYEKTNDDKHLIQVKTSDDNKVLGVRWNKIYDELVFKFNDITKRCEKALTKRDVLHCLASIYDPLGLINPIVVKVKCFFQKLCIEKINWDDHLSDELINEWKCIYAMFNEASDIRLNRCYSKSDVSDPIVDVQLHGFCDASMQAYGACVYLRVEKQSGQVNCELVSSKSRITPIKKQTIPRLELMGAVVLSELMNSVQNELSCYYKISKVVAWIDSTVAYYWITNNKQYKPFIQNRIMKINSFIQANQWKLINTKNNPADIVSRGMSPLDLVKKDLWFSGPKFLTLTENQWPQTILEQPTDELSLEINKTSVLVTETVLTPDVNVQNAFSVQKYYTFSKLARITTLVFKFINCLKKKVRILAADSTVRWPDTETLAADYTVRRPNTETLVADYTVRRPNTEILAADFDVRQPKIKTFSADYTVSQPLSSINSKDVSTLTTTGRQVGKYSLRHKKKCLWTNKPKSLLINKHQYLIKLVDKNIIQLLNKKMIKMVDKKIIQLLNKMIIIQNLNFYHLVRFKMQRIYG